MSEFHIKTKISFGNGSLSRLNDVKDKKIWIICDKFLAEGKPLQELLQHIDKSNIVDIFTNVIPDPPISVIASGIQAASRIQPEIMIGFGGGSAIDSAKGIVYFAKKMGVDSVKRFIAVPTTSGTGSEVTSATVITDPVSKVKYPIFVEELIPDIAILDANLVVTVPPNITANTGMDVLTHAIEAYVSKDATDFTDALAEKAARLTVHSLESCYQDGYEIENRERMHNASTLAGMAFNICNLGMTHSIAHQLGAQFHIPHGLANAMLLGKVITFNASNCKNARKKYGDIARFIGLCSFHVSDYAAVEALLDRIKKMMHSMKMPTSLSEFGIERHKVCEVVSDIADYALRDACLPTNPVKPSHDDIKRIVLEIL